MPNPRTYSVAFHNVAKAADAALDQPDGVTLTWLVERHGSLEQCAHLARGFQQTFTSLRARVRRNSMRIRGETHMRDTDARGVYDALHCQRAILPNGEGWSVTLAPSVHFLDAFDIIDNATGLPLKVLNAEKDKLTKLMLDAQDFKYPLTRAEWDWLNEQVPVFFTGGVEGGEVWRARPTE